jgi:hypothetical protein
MTVLVGSAAVVLVVELLLKPALLSLPALRLARDALDPVAATRTSQSQQLINTICTISHPQHPEPEP